MCIRDRVDAEAERARLGREDEKLGKEIARLEGKLANQGFVAKAPAEVVAKERVRLDELSATRTTLAQQLEKLLTL